MKKAIAAALILALLGMLVRQKLEIPLPSEEKLRQLKACAAELEKMDFLTAYSDWEKDMLEVNGNAFAFRGEYGELNDVSRIVKTDNGLFFIRNSMILTGARGYLVCNVSHPQFYDYQFPELIEGNVYRYAEGWD